MSWVTILWSMNAAACLTLVAIYLLVWSKHREDWEPLTFSCTAISVAIIAGFELAMMRSETTEQFGTLIRWAHLPLWTLIVSLVWFVRFRLRAGRTWLAWSVCGLRSLALFLNFLFQPNLNYRQITSLQQISWWGGEKISVATGVPNPWMLIGHLGLLLLLFFLIDATVAAWRRGDRRQAFIVGGSAIFFVTVGSVPATLVIWGVVRAPFLISFSYLGIVVAMAYELSTDVLQAAEVARQLRSRESALRESEARFRTVADSAPVLIWMSGVDKLCTFFNKPWLDFTGRTLEQEVGNGWAQGVHPDDLQKCLDTYVAAFDAREAFVMQYRLRRNDGEYRWVLDEGVARYDTQGNFGGYIGSCVDVTELINKDEALRESEERMRLAADAVNLGIWEWDFSKDNAWVTDTRRALLGWPASGKITLEHFMSRVHPDDRNRVRQAIDDVIHKGKDYDSEYRMILSDGSVRWMSTHASVRFDGTGKPARLLGISIDITARKQAELDARQRRDDLSHLSRVALMGEMSASLAHELNQPLSGIVSNAGAGVRFIDRGDVDLQELRALLADISADGLRAGEVIRGIRRMVKKGETKRQPVDLNNIVMNVALMIGPDALLHSCKVETSLKPNLPLIKADPIQIQQVLINLVINGLDAMRDTPVQNRKILMETERNGNGVIEVSVRDHGGGMPDEARERLFDRFFTTKSEGLGMGLAIARSIIEAHDGTIDAENVVDGGARFYFTLPLSSQASR